jgi:hypothetical protein
MVLVGILCCAKVSLKISLEPFETFTALSVLSNVVVVVFVMLVMFSLDIVLLIY